MQMVIVNSIFIFQQIQYMSIQQKIYPRMLLTLGIAAGVYLIFALVVLLFVQSQKREKMNRMEKEFYLVQAISSIYDVNLILYPKENTWEPVVETSQLKEIITGIKEADKMLTEFAQKLMLESARETFLEFTDLTTLSERMKERNFLGCTIEAITGKWYQMLLVSKKRDDENGQTSVLLLIRNVSEQKKKEMDYQEQASYQCRKSGNRRCLEGQISFVE